MKFETNVTGFIYTPKLQEKTRSIADWSAQHARVIFGIQFERR